MKYWDEYEKQCTCNNYQPYTVLGNNIGLQQPFGSCTNCWHKPLAVQTYSWHKEDLESSLKRELEKISTMSKEEFERMYYGTWENKEADGGYD